VTPAEAHKARGALARRTRKAQGLPKAIRDPEAIRRVVALIVRDHRDHRDEGAA
jgi:hypothetical protein